jgi:metallophosphoesterase (TIGR00282 family)
MQNKLFRIILVGDVMGKYGRRLLGKVLPLLRIKYSPHLVIANGENSAGGLGIIPKTAFEIFDAGVDIITTGNHVWDKKEALQLLKENDSILRPINFPPSAPGYGFTVYEGERDVKVLVVNLQGRVFMDPVVDNPFLAMDNLLEQRKEKMIIVDFHAEATAEKQAMGFYLDGRVSAVLGTHTHVQTSDLRILNEGTAYQSDVGMTGALDSVIGMKRDAIIRKFVTGVNQRFEVCKKNMIMDLSMIDIDGRTGKAVTVEPLRLYEDTYEEQLKF